MDKATFIARYGQAVEQRRATVLVGAGLSLGAGYPDWPGLLAPLREELGQAEMEELPLLAQYIENTVGRERLVAEMCEAIGSVDPRPTESHRLLAELPIDTVWTTNFDPLVEMASDRPELVELDEQLIDADASARRVYKMHGSIRFEAIAPEGGIDKLVITRDDFTRYQRDHPRFSRLLQADFLTRSFLFLGFSMSDPNFEAARKLVHLTTPDRPMTHYAVLRREGGDFDLRVADLAKVGIEVIEIADHDEIPDLLRRVVARTRPRGTARVSGALVSQGPVRAPVRAVERQGTILGTPTGQAGNSCPRTGVEGLPEAYQGRRHIRVGAGGCGCSEPRRS